MPVAREITTQGNCVNYNIKTAHTRSLPFYSDYLDWSWNLKNSVNKIVGIQGWFEIYMLHSVGGCCVKV